MTVLSLKKASSYWIPVADAGFPGGGANPKDGAPDILFRQNILFHPIFSIFKRFFQKKLFENGKKLDGVQQWIRTPICICCYLCIKTLHWCEKITHLINSEARAETIEGDDCTSQSTVSIANS